ncbi:DUF1802 family protein [Pseudokineococcus sp. 1T1Z-3]|uniref:DUF1802 family protein n=1 Tax=Pseudokineococcus sp. 1T1Z-3 TaxID=3132745 RepID=UPI0030A3AE86
MSTKAGDLPALKEWGAVAHALLRGRQCLLLRKGGIHEKRFEVGAGRFLLFPTVAHSHAEQVRPEHQDLLPAGAADSTEERVVLRCALDVVDVVPVERPEALADVGDLHIWTRGSVDARLDFRPRHRLTALVVRARPLAEPVVVERGPRHRGCSSWVDLAEDLEHRADDLEHRARADAGDVITPERLWSHAGPPALDDATLQRAAGAVRRALA